MPILRSRLENRDLERVAAWSERTDLMGAAEVDARSLAPIARRAPNLSPPAWRRAARYARRDLDSVVTRS